MRTHTLLPLLTTLALAACGPAVKDGSDDAPDGDTAGDTSGETLATGGPDQAVFATNDGVSLVDLATGALTPVSTEGSVSHLRLSPSGARVAWGDGEAWAGEIDGTEIVSMPSYDTVDFLDDGNVVISGAVMTGYGFMLQFLDENVGYAGVLYEDAGDARVYTSRFALDDGRLAFSSGTSGDGYRLNVLVADSLAHYDAGMDAEVGACEPVWLLGGETVACGEGTTIVVGGRKLDDTREVSLPLSIRGDLVPVSDRAVLAVSETVTTEDAACYVENPDDAGDPCIVEIDLDTGDARRLPLLEAQDADLTNMLVSSDGPTLFYAAGDTLVRAHPDGTGATTILTGVSIRDLDW